MFREKDLACANMCWASRVAVGADEHSFGADWGSIGSPTARLRYAGTRREECNSDVNHSVMM